MSDYFRKQAGTDYFQDIKTEVPEEKKDFDGKNLFEPETEKYQRNQTKVTVKRYAIKRS